MREYTVHHGDALEVLRTMDAGSAQTCVTSPPYWGLRDYGTDGQLGLEASPEQYVEKMVEVFREVRRVLRDDGTLWLNLGDSYFGGRCGARDPERWPKQSRNDHMPTGAKDAGGGKQKDLVGIPWRVAFALQADGWYLRSDIIWSKPNPMPESVTDRPTKAHEYIFLMSKSQRYYYDAEVIKEPVTGGAHARGNGVNPKALLQGDHPRNVDCRYQAPGQPEHTGLRRKGLRAKQNPSFSAAVAGLVDTRNKRSVWTVQSHAFPEAHFATFPPKLIEPCVLAGCPTGGVVLDPFCGSGTTGLVALRADRRFVGIELNDQYVTMARDRIHGDGPLLNQEVSA